MSPYIKRLAEQVLTVFGAGFLSAFSLSDMSTLKAAAFAGGAATLQFLYGVLAKHVGDPETPNVK